jgi:putative aminopeptidase FrvX
MKALIQKLVEAIGPSGYEDAVRQIVLDEVKPLADDVRVDALGNLIVRKSQRSEHGQRILLAAHLDEIGIIATHIEDNGFVRFTNVGFVRSLANVAGRVRFLNGVQGLVAVDQDSATSLPGLDKLFIDVGATSRADCPVKVGDVAAFERPFLELGDRLVAKSMDNRISVAILIETLRGLAETPHEVNFVFSVQEEVGTRGATTAAYAIDPDIALAVDVTMTGDTPKAAKMAVSLGKGPAIKVRDSGMLADPRLVRAMVATAEQAGLPYQMEVLDGGSTDARAMQLARGGVPAGCVSIPCRYVHSPSEMVDYHDVQNAVQFLIRLLSRPIQL